MTKIIATNEFVTFRVVLDPRDNLVYVFFFMLEFNAIFDLFLFETKSYWLEIFFCLKQCGLKAL